MHSTLLDTDTRGQLGLTTLADGRCELVNIRLDANKGSVEQIYSVKDMELPGTFTHDFGAVFVNGGQRVMYGSVQGCVMVWDRSNGDVAYGLRHGEGEAGCSASVLIPAHVYILAQMMQFIHFR